MVCAVAVVVADDGVDVGFVCDFWFGGGGGGCCC